MDVERKKQREIEIVRLMIALYCRKKHQTRGSLCEMCKALEYYASEQIQKCPFAETKTFCSQCKVHCYRPDMRERIREIMRFSGPRLILYHPVMVIRHMIDTRLKGQKMKLRKQILCGVGIVLTGLGAVGAVVPLLPAFPFLLGAMVCFAKSSQKLHDWFIHSKLYQNNLQSYVEKRAMTIKTKVMLLISITAAMGIGFLLMSHVPVGRVVLAVVWLFHFVYFIFGIKTLKEKDIYTEDSV